MKGSRARTQAEREQLLRDVVERVAKASTRDRERLAALAAASALMTQGSLVSFGNLPAS